ncbi:MAG: WbqC family protein [Paludibacter sp.]|nr:WbqC family protein [Paludibacter sp.]MDD4198357.1 WbqC family protein [Paludibacter sp.]MDD4428332.1 WbqC family protein [Paludibacter sp.]
MQDDRLKRQNNIAGKYCLSTAYLAPVEYYLVLTNADEILLEQYEFFVKQSYRNRCVIATANGLMDLTIPVEKSEGGKILIRDVRVSRHGNWQIQHWRSIESAYNSSPFFEFYADDLVCFYERKWNFLWDFNLELQQKMLELIDSQPEIKLTTTYVRHFSDDVKDLRAGIHPKKEPGMNHFQPYYQVFQEKYGFQQNLSILDLLLNMGNEAILTLKNREK